MAILKQVKNVANICHKMAILAIYLKIKSCNF